MQSPKIKVTESARQLQRELTQLVRDQMDLKGGRIRFGEFMQMALYHPGLGYYQNGLQKFGEGGDFITAPELGDLFAASIVESLTTFSGDMSDVHREEVVTDSSGTLRIRPFNWLELGAGSGILASDILSHLASAECLPDKYYILEPSATLKARQRELLKARHPDFFNRVVWLSSLPTEFNGVIIANEVIDAIPCERIQKVGNHWHYLDVVSEGSELVWAAGDIVPDVELPEMLCESTTNSGDPSDDAHNYPNYSSSVRSAGQLVNRYVDGYTTELRPLVRPWLSALSASLNFGSILLVDYGYPEFEYYHHQRTSGTLQCFCRHQMMDEPLKRVGLQDITAHVNFSSLATEAFNLGLSVQGFTTQSGFLLENNILEKMPADPNLAYRFSQQVQKLTAPGQMGELIKVLLLQKGEQAMPGGFQLQSQLHRL